MSKFSSPIPVQTKIVDNLELSIPWRKWFQGLGDDWVSANQIKGKTPNFKYVVNGILCFFTFLGPTAEPIQLPYTGGIDSVINGQIIIKGTKEITLSVPCSGYFHIATTN